MKIALVAPSYHSSKSKFDKNKVLLKNHSFDFLLNPKKNEIYNGTVSQRLSNFKKALKYDLIWAARGGEGGHHLVHQLKNVKTRSLLVGYSDFTYFHLWANLHCRQVSLHAPMWSERLTKVQKRVFNDLFNLKYFRPQEIPLKSRLKRYQPIEGPIIGGNLAILASCAGTWLLKKVPKNSILFLEEIDEELHRVDRMLGQLVEAGFFKNIQAVVVGEFLGLNERDYGTRWTLSEVLKRNLGNIPFFTDLEVGHIEGSRMIPLGVMARLEKNNLTLKGFHCIKGQWIQI